MKLPNGDHAVVELVKLTGYCLNHDHPRGRHKARVFAAVLGFTADHAELVRDALLAAAQTGEAVPAGDDEYGRRFTLDVTMDGPAGSALVRSGWIVRTGEEFPRLTSCYVA